MNSVVVGETIRRHRTSVAYILYLVLTGSIGMIAATFSQPAAMWPTLVYILSVITGSALIGPEFSSGALQLVVVKPVRRSSYVLSRAAGVFIIVAIVALVAAFAESTMRVLLRSGMVQPIAIMFANVLVEAMLTIALLTMLGSLTRSYFNTGIFLVTQAVFSATEAILGALRVRGPAATFLDVHREIEAAINAVDDVLFPTATPVFDPIWIMRVIATAAVAITLACIAFSRREVPYASE